ncbi:hypothetical protein BH09VER1_BH09VER1_34460 [soil metagenome]
MKTLLVPLDFSETTNMVIQQAAELARLLPARLILLHIVEPVATYVPVGGSMDVIASAPPLIDTEAETSSQAQRLEDLAQPLRSLSIEVETAWLVGLAVDDIVEQAELRKADFIVVGSHGHGALYHLFSGSVVNGVLQHTKIPVIVIPAPTAK